jgi:hypothetical protein
VPVFEIVGYHADPSGENRRTEPEMITGSLSLPDPVCVKIIDAEFDTAIASDRPS